MALNAYLQLKGQTSGDIRGSVSQRGREGKILVIAAAHGITSPRDVATGQATGKRAHKPFVITKEVDRASPLLYRALISNENLTTWKLQFWRPQVGPAGTAEVQHYTVALTNAAIASIEFRMPNTKVPDTAQLEAFEEVSFTYQKIEWTWTDGGVTATDTWVAQV